MYSFMCVTFCKYCTAVYYCFLNNPRTFYKKVDGNIRLENATQWKSMNYQFSKVKAVCWHAIHAIKECSFIVQSVCNRRVLKKKTSALFFAK